MTHRTARLAGMAAVLAFAALSGGCLVKDTNATLCLEPDGAVTWTVIERNIHATGDTPADRQREEEEFMALVGAGQHPNAVAFRSLGATDVRTEVISSSWPFAVLTQAHLRNVADAFQVLLDRVPELHARSVMQRDGDRTTWTLSLEKADDAAQTGADNSDPFPASLLDDDQPTILMRHGQFIAANGFDISDDNRVAKLADLDDWDWDKNPRMVLSLTWVATEAVNAAKK